MILMAVIAAPLGWWSWNVERQRRAVESLHKSGAWIYYKDGGKVNAVKLDSEPANSDIKALQALDGLERVFLPSSNNEAKVRAALPNCMVTTESLLKSP